MNKKTLQPLLLYASWIQAIMATLGSLYFSEILQWQPCVLCWYQRIFIYPLVLIIAIGILKKDKNLPTYVLAMVTTGGLIAFYHTLLQYGVITESLAPCSFGVSCVTQYGNWFGFITIPLLSFMNFLLIGIYMILYRKFEQK